jgi:hypothetical protein
MATTWRAELNKALLAMIETWADIESNTMTDAEMDEEFYNGYGGHEGCAFTVWTHKRVYFPAGYDGSEWVESVARHPDGHATPHIGGGG